MSCRLRASQSQTALLTPFRLVRVVPAVAAAQGEARSIRPLVSHPFLVQSRHSAVAQVAKATSQLALELAAAARSSTAST